LDRRIAAYRQMKADGRVALADRNTERTLRLELTGGMMRFDWRSTARRSTTPASTT